MVSYYKFKNLGNNFTYCMVGKDLFDCVMQAKKVQPDKSKRLMLGMICTRDNKPYEYELQFLQGVDIVTNVYKRVKNV